MQTKEVITIVGSIIASIGGIGVLIFALSKWIGQIIANNLLEKYKFRHEKDLEKLKSDFRKELELTKADIEKSTHSHIKYSDEQFNFYNKLWKFFWQLKKRTDDLWDSKLSEKLNNFSLIVHKVKETIYENILVIDKLHTDKILGIINDLESLNFLQFKLADLRKFKIYTDNNSLKSAETEDDEEYYEIKNYSSFNFLDKEKTYVAIIPNEITSEVLNNNKALKDRIDSEILAISDLFRKQMQGNLNDV